MKNPVTIIREAGSVIAGLLVGASIVVPVLAMTIADPDGWQLFWVFGALFILALGLALQVAVMPSRVIGTQVARRLEPWPPD